MEEQSTGTPLPSDPEHDASPHTSSPGHIAPTDSVASSSSESDGEQGTFVVEQQSTTITRESDVAAQFSRQLRVIEHKHEVEVNDLNKTIEDRDEVIRNLIWRQEKMHERQEEMHKRQVGIEDLFKKFVNQVFDRIEGIEARISQGLGTVEPVALSTPGPAAPIPQDISAPGPSGASLAAAPVPEGPSNDAQSVEGQIAKLKESMATYSLAVSTVQSNVDTLDARLKTIEDKVRNMPPPGMTAWQAWKGEACSRLGVGKPTDKPASDIKYKCVQPGCNYRDKCVSLNAYILHVRRHHGVVLNVNPDRSWLPALC